MLLVAATGVGLVSVPAAIAVQIVVVALAFYDARRAARPEVERVVWGPRVLHGVLHADLQVSAAGAKVRLTDDLGPGLERMAPGRSIADASPEHGVVVATPDEGSAVAGFGSGCADGATCRSEPSTCGRSVRGDSRGAEVGSKTKRSCGSCRGSRS